jgi:hypothetical protein
MNNGRSLDGCVLMVMLLVAAFLLGAFATYVALGAACF